MNLNINEINFKDLLNDVILETEDICLISKNKLNDSKIKLVCGHQFNYVPLYKEIIRQKTDYNPLSNIILKRHQIQCPYCRNIQNSILPFKKMPGVEKCYGVNIPICWQMLVDTCSYKFKYGKKKGLACNKPCNGLYCNSHIKHLDNKVITTQVYKIKNKEDDKFYNLEELNVIDLKKIGKQQKIKGYYKLRKIQLINQFKKMANSNFIIE